MTDDQNALPGGADRKGRREGSNGKVAVERNNCLRHLCQTHDCWTQPGCPEFLKHSETGSDQCSLFLSFKSQDRSLQIHQLVPL